MLDTYRQHVAERAALGIPPLPLTAKQTAELIELLKNPPAGEEQNLVELLTHRVPAGVDDAAKVKASYLAAVALGKEACALISRAKATELLGTMLGGYNIGPLVELLDDAEIGTIAADALKKTLLMFDAFHDVKEKADRGNANAKSVLQSWADAEWFTSRPELPESLTITVFKVPGETNTDDLSPAPDATTRPDIPMHALAMLKNKRDGAAFEPEEDGKRGPVQFIESLKDKGHLVAYVGDVVGYRFLAQVGHQLGAVVHGRRHPLRAEQALWRRVPGQQDRPDLLQHHGRRRRPADRTRRFQDGNGRRGRTAPVRRQGHQERRSHRRIRSEVRRAVRRSARRRPHSADHRPRPDGQGARSPGPAGLHAVPPAQGSGRLRPRLHPGPEDGRPRLRPAGRQGRAPGHLLRTEDDLGGQPRTPPAP